ncbi:MAG: putative C-S lyase [Acholeplasmataceae bacterium]|nr:putative C-S lyase [Acholeplasmataceae bacterium]
MDYFNGKFSRYHTNSYKWDHPLKTTGRKVLPFTVADSDYPTAPEIIQALKKRIENGAFGYTFLDDEYYANIISWVERRYHYQIKADWILPTTGVVSSLTYAVLALTEPGDKIVIQTPVYNPFYSIVTENGRKLVQNPLLPGKTYRMDLEDLEKCFQSGVKMLILCSPHNPVGRLWSKAELEELIALCRRYQVLLVSDEIHCDLVIGNREFVSLGHYFSEYQKIVVITAPSKTFNLAGLGISHIFVSDESLREAIKKLISILHIKPNLLALAACQAAYSCCDYWVDLQNEHLTNQFHFLKEFFKKNLPEAEVTEIEGTYLAWVDLRFLKLSSKDIYQGLLEYGVAINRGDTYGRDYDGFIRINLACSREQLDEGLTRLYRFITNL